MAYSWAYVTVAATLKTDDRASKIGKLFLDDSYVFGSRGLVVLESVRRDNAIYVFGLDWKRFAQLSKAEILSNGYHKSRIIHSKGWKQRIGVMLNADKAA